MNYDALFLGSIGVLADSSDLQRQAFNHAFERFGLGWHWDWDTYAALLKKPGGRQRIADYAELLGQADEVDVSAVYAVKQGAFDALVAAKTLNLRPGVADLMQAARKARILRALVTSTTRRQIETTFAAVGRGVAEAEFDLVTDGTLVSRAKPSPDIYLAALDALEVRPGAVLAVEDTPESAEAARAAGLSVIGFPGRAAYGRRFPDGVPVVECLTPGLLAMPRLAVAAE